MEKKALSGIMLILLLAGMLTLAFNIQPVKAEPQLPLISLNPMELEVPAPGLDFTIDVNITDVADLGCFEFKLGYNTTILDATYVSATSVTSICTYWIPIDPDYLFHPDGPPTINDTIGRVWVGAIFPMGQEFTGSGTLVTISFTATGVGSCTLHLYDTVLGDSLANPIEHTTLDGSVTVVPPPPPPPPAPPIADFDWVPTFPYVGEEVICYDTSAPNGGEIIAWLWEIEGPATPLTPMNEREMRFRADCSGIVKVTLTVWDTEGMNDTTSRLTESLTILPGRILIRADGSVDPPDAPISSVGNVTYILTGNIYPHLIIVLRDNIVLDGAGYTVGGIACPRGSNGSTIKNTQIKGGRIYLIDSSNNIIQGNNITNGPYGIELIDSSNNIIYHNNFINNTIQVYSENSVNTWDDGYPSGGNYWSDYTGVDANGDGIGDTPYIIDEYNRDRYPLMKPWTPTLPPPLNQPPVANFTYFPTEPKAGEQVTFNASSSYDVDGEIVSYEWDWDYDGDFDVYTGSPIPITFWWVEDGDYRVGLKVTDNKGAVSILYKAITIRKSSTSKDNAILAGWFDWLHWWWWKNHKHFVTIDGWLREFEPESKPLDWLKGTKFAWCEEADVVYIFDKEIDPARAPGLTYKIHALNTIYEEELVDEAFWNSISPEAYYYYAKLIGKLIVGSVWGLPTKIGEQVILDLAPTLGTGVSTILLALKVHSIIDTFKEIDKVAYTWALGVYFWNRRIDEDQEDAWNHQTSSLVEATISPWASEEEKKEILQATKWYFEKLWLEYKDHGREKAGLYSDFRKSIRNKLKSLLLSGLEKYKNELPNMKRAQIASPGELRVYDSQGRVTGLVDREVREEVPNSVYDDDTKTVKIFFPSDSYRYEVAGTEEGTYGLEITSVEDGEATTFTATDIPTVSGAIHQYAADWDALSRGEEGATVQVDSDGDGLFEHAFASDGELSHGEYVIATDKTPPETWLNISEPKFVVNEITYLTSATPIALIAEDNPGGSGVASTAYRIHNATYDSGWITYTQPFYLIGLSDGTYQIDYNSTDNAGNIEAANSIQVTLFSWNYVFTDSYGRGTTLKINTAHKIFQFITSDEDYGIRNATYMRICSRTIIILHKDNELELITLAIDTKLDFCIAYAKDMQTDKKHWLIDKVGTEN